MSSKYAPIPLHSIPWGRDTQFTQCYREEREAQSCTCILNIVHIWHVDKTKCRHYNMYRNAVSKWCGCVYFWRKQHFSVPLPALLHLPQHHPQNPAQEPDFGLMERVTLALGNECNDPSWGWGVLLTGVSCRLSLAKCSQETSCSPGPGCAGSTGVKLSAGLVYSCLSLGVWSLFSIMTS